MSASPFSLVKLGSVINRWKYLMGGALVLAALVSAAVALSLPNIYKSTAVFFPTNPQSTDPDRIVDGGKLEISGRAEDLDRAITIGLSQPVAELIIKRFNLYKHYGAGTPGDDQADNAVLMEFSGNLDIVHNERDAIELTFHDKDKKVAADIANAVVEAIDSVNQQLTRENRLKVLALYQVRYDSVRTRYERSRRQLLRARNRYGIFGLEMQGRYMAKQLIETEAALRRAEANGGDVAGLRRSLHALTKADGGNLINVEDYVQGADSLVMFTSRVTNLQTRLIGAQEAYETARLAMTGQVSSLYIVQKAYPATRKSAPVRWLIVAGTVLLTFALSVVVIGLLELYRYQQKQSPEGLA